MDDRPTLRPELAWLIVRASDGAMLILIWLVYQWLNPSGFSGGMYEPSTVPGLPWGAIVVGLGVASAVVGWIWIRLIYRGEPEPEANDKHWLSRT